MARKQRMQRNGAFGGPNQQPGNAVRRGMRANPLAAPKRKGANMMSRKPGKGGGVY